MSDIEIILTDEELERAAVLKAYRDRIAELEAERDAAARALWEALEVRTCVATAEARADTATRVLGVMMMRLAIAIAASLAILPAGAEAKTHRSHQTTHEFQMLHPCPSTGLRTGACPGYVKDHIIALCKGGPDTPANMQWQTTAAAKAKDKWECK